MKIDINRFYKIVEDVYLECKDISGGENAGYIPYLRNVPSDLFGIAVSLPDGTVIAYGDTEYIFGIESVSKVPTALLIMEQYGPEELKDRIGADAMGLPFNSILAYSFGKRPSINTAGKFGSHICMQYGKTYRERGTKIVEYNKFYF